MDIRIFWGVFLSQFIFFFFVGYFNTNIFAYLLKKRFQDNLPVVTAFCCTPSVYVVVKEKEG
jgi:hypothetical protein